MVGYQTWPVVNESMELFNIEKMRGTYAMRASFSRSDSTCASSVGGPGLNLGEHIAGRSKFGTTRVRIVRMSS